MTILVCVYPPVVVPKDKLLIVLALVIMVDVVIRLPVVIMKRNIWQNLIVICVAPKDKRRIVVMVAHQEVVTVVHTVVMGRYILIAMVHPYTAHVVPQTKKPIVPALTKWVDVFKRHVAQQVVPNFVLTKMTMEFVGKSCVAQKGRGSPKRNQEPKRIHWDIMAMDMVMVTEWPCVARMIRKAMLWRKGVAVTQVKS